MNRNVRLWILLLLGACTPAQGQNVKSLTILHSNDLHAHLNPDADGSGGFAYLATELRHQREGCSACLYLNAGDLVQGTPVSTIFHGLPVYELANSLGFDASTLGNHEFDYTSKGILGFVRAAHFPIVSANVLNQKNEPATGRAFVIKEVGQLRVAIIGAVMGDLVGNLVTAEEVVPWHVLPVVETVKKTVAQLKGKADLVIVLGHLRNEEVDQILHDVPEVSIVVAGHYHDGYKDLKEFQHRYAVQIKSYGFELGRLDFRFDVDKHEVLSADWKRIPINSHDIAPDPALQAQINTWEAKVSKVVDVPIGTASRRIEGEALRKLIEKSMADAVGADVAFIDSGNVRAFLPQGQLLARHVWDALPFDDYIRMGSFRGRDLPPAITKDFPVDPDRLYKLAITDFAVANQSSASQLGTQGLKFPVKGPLQRDAMISWIRRKKVIE